MRATAAPRRAGAVFRADLEGMRGIALGAILLVHLVGWPTGGQVGLDVFFVLSGFLITSLLLAEHARTGAIDLPAFYRRRIRRLAPAAAVVIVATLVASALVLPLGRLISIAWDALWATLLVANWGFALGGTDYFATDLPQSPLLHYWSLAVEEQFYLTWPVLLLGALALGARGRRQGAATGRLPAVAVLVVAIGASFAWSLWQSSAEPQVAYLSTLTRVWELGVGALAAVWAPAWSRIPSWVRPVLAWTGLLAILYAAVVVRPETPYPGVAALVPVLSTAAIIASGVGGPNHLVAVANPVVRYVGRISYSAYVWHWPVIVLTAAVVGTRSPWYLVTAVPLVIVLSVATHHLVEDPVRRSRWLEPVGQRSVGIRGIAARRRMVGASVAMLLVGALVAVVAVRVTDAREGAALADAAGQGASATEVADDEQQVAALVEEGLALEAWPTDATPSFDAVASGTALAALSSDPCLTVLDAEGLERCVRGDASAPRTAVLLGDSTAYAWVPALDRALASMGMRLVVLTAALCPFADVRIDGTAAAAADAAWSDACQEHRTWAIQQAIGLGAQLIVATDSDIEPSVMADPVPLATLRSTWAEALRRSADAATAGGAHLVLLPPPPGAENLAVCRTTLSTPRDCTTPIRDEWQQMYLASGDVASAAEHVTLVDSIDWFCADGFCPAVAGSYVVRMDSQHLTPEYAGVLSSVLEERLRAALGETEATPEEVSP